jgi:nitroreductase
VTAAAQTVLDLMATTRSLRRFHPEPIPGEDLALILRAATCAPSAANRQPARFLILAGDARSPARRLLGDAFREAWHAKRQSDGFADSLESDPDSPRARTARTMQTFVDGFETIPVVVLACLVQRFTDGLFDGASVYPACQNLLLAARALGYGGTLSTWHTGREAELRALLAIPDEAAIAATIALGRPVGPHGPLRRRPLADVVFDGTWGRSPAWASDPPAAPGPAR